MKNWLTLPIICGVAISLSGLIVLLVYRLPATSSVLILEGGNLALVFAAVFVSDNRKSYANLRYRGILASIVLFVLSAILGAISYAVGNSLVLFYTSLGICCVGVLGVRLSIQLKPKAPGLA